MTTHPATRAMVDYYAGWYDRHFDLDIPMIDLNSLRQMFQVPRRPVSTPSQAGSAAGPWQSDETP
jgi:hypothetical protein